MQNIQIIVLSDISVPQKNAVQFFFNMNYAKVFTFWQPSANFGSDINKLERTVLSLGR